METSTPQPGQTVSPTGPQSDTGASEPEAEASRPPASPPAQLLPADPAEPAEPSPPASEVPDETGPSDTAPEEISEEATEGVPEETPASAQDSEAIMWTASEFIDHAKPFGWYAALMGSALAFAVVVYLVTRDLVSVGVVIIAALLLGIYAGHKPKQLEYRLDSSGLSVGPRHFGYNEFRSFSVLPEGGISSIVFMPLKRFAVPTTIYYPPDDEDRIVGMLADRLPMEKRDHDAVDKLMHRIRF